MAKKLYEESNIQAIADAIRTHTGSTRLEEMSTVKVSKTSNATGFTTRDGSYANKSNTFDVVTIPGATKLKVKMGYQTENVSYDYVQVMQGNVSSGSGDKYGGQDTGLVELEFEGDTVTFLFVSDASIGTYLGYYAEVRGLAEVSNEYLVSEMADAILGIEAGGGGGAAVETCTVEVQISSKAYLYEYAYTHLTDDGSVTTACAEIGSNPLTNTTYNFENVICGSLIYIFAQSQILGVWVENMSMAHDNTNNLVIAPSTGGSKGIIHIIDDD